MQNSCTHFLNADLELQCGVNTQALISALEKDLFILNPGQRNFACFEVRDQAARTLDDTINAFHYAYRQLSREDVIDWKSCPSRIINVGIQAGLTPQQLDFKLSDTAINQLAEMEVFFIITVYAPQSE